MFDRKPTGKSVRVPVGRYRVYGWTVERKDREGNLWKGKAHSFGTPDIVNVIEGEESALSIGQRLVAVVTALEVKGVFTFTLRLKGEMGETIRLTENGESVTGGVLVRNVLEHTRGFCLRNLGEAIQVCRSRGERPMASKDRSRLWLNSLTRLLPLNSNPAQSQIRNTVIPYSVPVINVGTICVGG